MVGVLPITQEIDASDIEQVLIDQHEFSVKPSPGAEHPGPKPWPENTQLNALGLDPGTHALRIGPRSESIDQEPNLEAARSRATQGLNEPPCRAVIMKKVTLDPDTSLRTLYVTDRACEQRLRTAHQLKCFRHPCGSSSAKTGT
jgi:hypothetical protein